MSIKGKMVTWSPQGWLLSSPTARGEDVKKLTFSEISYAVLDTVNESGRVHEEMTDAVEKNKLDHQRKLLKSAAAQFVAAGKFYLFGIFRYSSAHPLWYLVPSHASLELFRPLEFQRGQFLFFVVGKRIVSQIRIFY